MEDLDDFALMDLVACKGAEGAEALWELAERHGATMYRMLLKLLRSPQDAEEVWNDAFMNAWSGGSTFDRRKATTVRAWIASIAWKAGLDLLRRDSQRSARERSLEATPDWTLVNAARTSVDRADGSFEDIVDGAEFSPELKECLDQAPELQRAAALLIAHGFNRAELSYFLNKSSRQVETLVHRLKVRVRLRFPAEG